MTCIILCVRLIRPDFIAVRTKGLPAVRLMSIGFGCKTFLRMRQGCFACGIDRDGVLKDWPQPRGHPEDKILRPWLWLRGDLAWP